MKILILCDRIPPENAGGAEKVAWTIARGLRDLGHDVHVIAATEGNLFEEVREGIPTYHLHVHYPSRWQAYLSLYNPPVASALAALYARIQPDVVSAFNIHRDLTYHSLTVARHMGMPTTLTLQDVMAFAYNKLTHYIDPTACDRDLPEGYRLPPLYNARTMRLRYNPIRNRWIRRVINRVDVRIAASDALRQALAANGLSGFRVIHAAVEPADFNVSPAAVTALRERLELHGKRVLLFAGRLTTEKGSQQVLAALDRLRQTVPDVTLLTLTRATPEQQGLTVPEYQHLRDHVTIGGWMQGEDLAAAYHLADVVVAPSVCFDTFPTVNLEGMAAKKPIVATCYGGSREAVLDGKTGYIVNPCDTASFTDRLHTLFTNPELRDRMGQLGHDRLLNHYTPHHIATQMSDVYEEIKKGQS